MEFDKMVLPLSDTGYSVVREAAVSLSLLLDGILRSLLLDGLSLPSHLAFCRFSPVSVLYVLLQFWHFKYFIRFISFQLAGNLGLHY